MIRRTDEMYEYAVYGFREWECCGLLWQLFLTRMWSDRENWNPVCPKCGATVQEDTE